jgi:hypothetical protein
MSQPLHSTSQPLPPITPLTSQVRQPANILRTHDTLNSASQIQPRGFCEQISTWVTTAVNWIRDRLSALPWIGPLFAREAQEPQTQELNDQDHFDVISVFFVRSNFPVPSRIEVEVALEEFSEIRSPLYKAKAFHRVITATNSTDEIAKLFYDALPQDLQNEFKSLAYGVNGSSIMDGHDHREGFGDYVVHHRIRSNVARTAANALVNARTPSPSTAQV